MERKEAYFRNNHLKKIKNENIAEENENWFMRNEAKTCQYPLSETQGTDAVVCEVKRNKHGGLSQAS